jgi:hypothetical protein
MDLPGLAEVAEAAEAIRPAVRQEEEEVVVVVAFPVCPHTRTPGATCRR